MPVHCTPASERALVSASVWAARFSDGAVQPAHVLLALLDEEEGHVAQFLAACGISPAQVRQALGAPAHHATLPPAVELPWAHSTQTILDRARQFAADTSADRTVTTGQLLLALLHTVEPLRGTLEQLGLDIGSVESKVLVEQQTVLHLEEPLQLSIPGEAIDIARILDVSANRAREALRVLEDHGRFVLDDPFLCRELKQLRHDLAEALEAVPLPTLLAARETLRDVGTGVTTEREQQRFSLAAVVQANAKRLQEALRSLEEYGKLHSAELGRRLEPLRYRAYTLERALLLGVAVRQRLADVDLCVLVTGAACAASLHWTIQEAVAGGAGMIQLREKALSDRDLLDRARQVRAWTRTLGVLFILNDRPDLARLSEADGVHLGQDDLPVKEARRIVGPDALIGVSTHNLEQVRQAILDGASYLGVGPTFSSGTKQFTEFAGLEFVRQATRETALPAFVIGGINLDTIREAVTAGARRVAVSQAIGAADDPRAVATALRQVLATQR